MYQIRSILYIFQGSHRKIHATNKKKAKWIIDNEVLLTFFVLLVKWVKWVDHNISWLTTASDDYANGLPVSRSFNAHLRKEMGAAGHAARIDRRRRSISPVERSAIQSSMKQAAAKDGIWSCPADPDGRLRSEEKTREYPRRDLKVGAGGGHPYLSHVIVTVKIGRSSFCGESLVSLDWIGCCLLPKLKMDLYSKHF